MQKRQFANPDVYYSPNLYKRVVFGRTALGMYELELAYMIIAHSQRDPGEYLLELQRFAAEPNLDLRRAALDAHLGRWGASMRHLLAAGDTHFQRALRLACEKVLQLLPPLL